MDRSVFIMEGTVIAALRAWFFKSTLFIFLKKINENIRKIPQHTMLEEIGFLLPPDYMETHSVGKNGALLELGNCVNRRSHHTVCRWLADQWAPTFICSGGVPMVRLSPVICLRLAAFSPLFVQNAHFHRKTFTERHSASVTVWISGVTQ